MENKLGNEACLCQWGGQKVSRRNKMWKVRGKKKEKEEKMSGIMGSLIRKHILPRHFCPFPSTTVRHWRKNRLKFSCLLYPLWFWYPPSTAWWATVRGHLPDPGEDTVPVPLLRWPSQLPHGLCRSTFPHRANKDKLWEPTQRQKTLLQVSADAREACQEQADLFQIPSELGFVSWCPRDVSSAQVCAEVIRLFQPFGVKLSVSLWNWVTAGLELPRTREFWVQCFQLLINRGTYYIVFLKLWYGI